MIVCVLGGIPQLSYLKYFFILFSSFFVYKILFWLHSIAVKRHHTKAILIRKHLIGILIIIILVS